MTIGPRRAFFAKSRPPWCAYMTHSGSILALFFLMLAGGHASAASCSSAPSGLIGWWPGDGNASTIVGTNNGSLQGTATASASGVVGSAFSFDGTNSTVQIADS